MQFLNEDRNVWIPMLAFLKMNHAEQKHKILQMMMFMGEEEGAYHYKNTMTRSYIVLDRSGQVLEQDEYALTIDE